LLPDTALIFEQKLEPVARVDTLRDCAQICEKDERCDGWTYLPRNFGGEPREPWEALRGACVMGSGVKGWSPESGLNKDILRNAPGRISGLIMSPLDAQGARTSTWEPGTALTPQADLGVLRHVKSPERCREVCLDDKRCTSWTYFDKPGGFCFTGIGVRERRSDPDITSGEIKE
jgi:hypothetical protein